MQAVKLFFLMPALLLLLAAPIQADTLIIWTDAHGVMNMTNKADFAPPAYRPKIKPAPVIKAAAPPKAVRAKPVAAKRTQALREDRIKATIESLEQRNQALENLQKVLQKILPGQ